MTQLVDAVQTDAEIRAELIQRAVDLQPLLRTNSAQSDRDRRVPDESIDAVLASGVFTVWVPKNHGGRQADMRTQMEILAALAEADSAVAWIGSLYTGASWSAALFSDEAQEEIWGTDPTTPICGGLSPLGSAVKVDGGYRVTGSYPWMSGSHHAKWALLSVPVLSEDGQMITVGYFAVPTTDLILKDTWYTLGMRGTGSNTFVAEDVFVPEHRFLPLLDETGAMNAKPLGSNAGGSLYRISQGSLCATWMIGVPLGIARAALAVALEQLPKRSISYTSYVHQRDAVGTQLAIARVSSMIDTAYLLARRACEDVDRVVNHDETLDMVTRARARQDTGTATRLLREAVDLIMQTCGASSVADFNPLQKHFRDMSTLTLHALTIPDIQDENYGRALLGLEPTITMC